MKKLVLFLLIILISFNIGCADDSGTDPDGGDDIDKAAAGDTLFTYVHCPENGTIAVRIQVPDNARYPEGAPIMVNSSGWFAGNYNFNLGWDFTEVGFIWVNMIWPGKTDQSSGVSSQGIYDYAGPSCIAAFRDVIRFACGLAPDTAGHYIDELIEMNAMTYNVGLHASSHSGVGATKVMGEYGNEFSSLKYFVGRENPTVDANYALETGHFEPDYGPDREPVVNPCYHPEDYARDSIHIDYSGVGWDYGADRPCFVMGGDTVYIVSNHCPRIDGKRCYSAGLMRALDDNNVFAGTSWPADLATPETAEDMWDYRVSVNSYDDIGAELPELKVILVFSAEDHCQAAPDKPHIHHAYDGFLKTADLDWVRLNPDMAYAEEIDPTFAGFPDNLANTEPGSWNTASSWGFPNAVTAVDLISLAAGAEMADRVRAGDWSHNLSGVLYDY